MATKYQSYIDRADEVALTLTRSAQNWTAFLTTAARLYKYPYHEQLMIYSQRPDATACAGFDIWNNRMGRFVKRGSKGIVLPDGNDTKYVFDVSDTGTRDKSVPFRLWEYKEEHRLALIKMASDKFNVSGSTLYDAIEKSANILAEEYWNDKKRNIIDIVANSFMEGYDEYNIKVNFLNAVTVSTTYSVLSRCGFNAIEYFEHEDFLPIFDFNTVDTISELGMAIRKANSV